MSEPSPTRGAAADRYPWQVLSSTRLAAPDDDPKADFFDVLASRRSTPPNRPLNFRRLSDLLWYAAAYRRIAADGQGRPWYSRSAASAGGVHPIEIFVEDPEWSAARYNPLKHAIEVVEIASRERWDAYRREIRRALPAGDGTMFTFLADVTATAARYAQPESLVLRDAGALVATFQLTATALNLACTPIGIKGETFVDAMGASPERFLACGVVCAGEI